MSSLQTETTEVAVGIGLLGYENPTNITPEEITLGFDGTLQQSVSDRIAQEYGRKAVYQHFYNLCLELRRRLYPSLVNIHWTGPQQ